MRHAPSSPSSPVSLASSLLGLPTQVLNVFISCLFRGKKQKATKKPHKTKSSPPVLVHLTLPPHRQTSQRSHLRCYLFFPLQSPLSAFPSMWSEWFLHKPPAVPKTQISLSSVPLTPTATATQPLPWCPPYFMLLVFFSLPWPTPSWDLCGLLSLTRPKVLVMGSPLPLPFLPFPDDAICSWAQHTTSTG